MYFNGLKRFMKEIKHSVEEEQTRIKYFERNKNMVSLGRLLIFVAAAFLIFKFLDNKESLYLFASLMLFAFFLALLFVSNHFQEKINHSKRIILVCQRIAEEFSLNHQINEPDTNYSHPYNKDLDIYGDISLFTKIDKTETYSGYNKLRFYLSNHLTKQEEIHERQEAIQELSSKLKWNIDFLASAKALEITKEGPVKSKFYIDFPSGALQVIHKLLIILPVVNIIFLGLVIAADISTVLSTVLLSFTIISSAIVNRKYGKQIQEAYSIVNLKSGQYSNFSDLFYLIENETFKSSLNRKIQGKLKNPSASLYIQKLARLRRNLDNGSTPLFGTLINLLFLWNLQHTVKLEKLMKEFNQHIDDWFDAFAEFEALISFGIFAAKNQDYIYPVCNADVKELEAEGLYHPLIPRERSISNDFTLGNTKNICIITGANMTGKSTFLRTIGVNLVLAMNGCPVAARNFVFRPMEIYTSMRTSDSLSDGSSYFNAEIKRLKKLVENLEEKIPQYIILDEILKGTNSTDKLEGSRLFLKRMIEIDTNFTCIIATHDLQLTDMIKTYPENIVNKCFELEEKDNLLIADYKLKPGVTQTMNALKLMKEYKIID